MPGIPHPSQIGQLAALLSLRDGLGKREPDEVEAVISAAYYCHPKIRAAMEKGLACGQRDVAMDEAKSDADPTPTRMER